MEAKESLCKVIKALIEINDEIPTDAFIDFMQGKQSSYLTETAFDELENFGIGENSDDNFWASVVAKAISCGYISSQKNELESVLKYTPAGKKYLKNPVSFEIEDESDEIQDGTIEVDDLDLEDDEQEVKTVKPAVTKKSSLKIDLIHAIDNKKDLDDFAESQGKDFLEILDDLESIIQSGMKINIDYFIDEVLDEEQVDEIMEVLDECSGNILKAMDKLDANYSEDEIRLVKIKYLVKTKR